MSARREAARQAARGGAHKDADDESEEYNARHDDVVTCTAPWTVDETYRLIDVVDRLGTHSWKHIASQVPGRSAKQCHHRLSNLTRPTAEERKSGKRAADRMPISLVQWGPEAGLWGEA